MEIAIDKEDYDKYDKVEILLKQYKTPIIINGKIQELLSNKNEFFIKTNIEQFKTNSVNIEAIHFKSQLTENLSKTIQEVKEYLDL